MEPIHHPGNNELVLPPGTAVNSGQMLRGWIRHPKPGRVLQPAARGTNGLETPSGDGGNGKGSIIRHPGKPPSQPHLKPRLFRGTSAPGCPQIPTFLQQQQHLRGCGSAQDSPCTFPRLICGFHICFFCLEEAFREATQPGLLTVFLATQGLKILQMDQNLC